MKGRTKFFALCLFINSVFSGCKKKDDSPIIAVDNGNWKVSYFTEGTDDITSHVSGYIFRFEKGGKAVASSSNSAVVGSWSAGTDDRKLKFILNFGPSPLNELNEDWEVMDQTPKALQLRHISGGSGGGDYLTFQKI